MKGILILLAACSNKIARENIEASAEEQQDENNEIENEVEVIKEKNMIQFWSITMT